MAFVGAVDWRTGFGETGGGDAAGGAGMLLACFSFPKTTFRLGFGETWGGVFFLLELSKGRVVGRFGDRFKSSRSGDSSTESGVIVTLPSRVGQSVSSFGMTVMM